MAWVKLDDAFLDHPKFIEAGPLAGYMAITAIAWSNRNLMDGFIPQRQVPRLVNLEGFAHRMWNGELSGGGEDAKAEVLANELVDAGLWEKVDGGYRIHDYHDYQPSAEAVRAERRKSAERKRQSRKRHGRSHGEVTPPPVARTRTEGTSEADASDSDNPSTLSSVPDDEERKRSEIPTGGRLSELLADLIAANDPNGKRPSVTKRWLDAERLLITRDGRDPEQVEALIRWCQADEFERSNVLSMPKLRTRFTGLWQKAQRSKGSGRVAELVERGRRAAA